MNKAFTKIFIPGPMGDLRDDVEKRFDDVKEIYATYDLQSFEKYFELQKYFEENNLKGISWPKLEYSTNESDNINDFKNAKKLHAALKLGNFPNSLSLSERLWTWLAHTQYKEYVIDRWFSNESDKEESIQKRILNRFFFGQAPQMRHALARLYWIAEVTYDAENTLNPYWLTEIAFNHLGQADRFIERKIGSNPLIVKSAMKAIYMHSELIAKNGGLGKAMAKIALEFNQYAAIVAVDALSKYELETYFNNELEKALTK